MEILDPNTRSCTFLTLTKYVGEKGRVEPAVCSMRKDEAFLDSTNTFVAAESWRLSCAPNPKGIVYHWIPKEYWISVETENGAVHAPDEKTQEETDITSLNFIDILQDKVAMPDKQMFAIAPIEPADADENEVDIDEIAITMFKDMNDSRVTQNSRVTLKNCNNDDGYYIIKDDPYKQLRGPGYDPMGITSLRGRYKGNRDPHDNTPAQDTPVNPNDFLNTIHLNFMKFTIKKATVPYISLEDLKIFFSTGVCFWRDYGKNSTTGKLPYWICNGPIYVETSDHTMTHMALNHQLTPIHQLYTDSGDYFRNGAKVYQKYHDANDGNHLKIKTATIVGMYNEDWAFESLGGDYIFWLSVIPTAEGLAHNTAYAANPTAFGANGNEYFYYPYTHSEITDDNTRNIYKKLKSSCEIEMFGPDPNDPTKFVPAKAENSVTSQTPVLVHGVTYRTVIKRQATRGEPIPSYTPNDFMQWFNSGFGKEDQPYVLTTSPNGGWRLVVLTDGLSNLSISKAMCDNMGLLPYMTVDGIEKTSLKNVEKTPVVVNIKPDKTDTQHWYWNWQGDYDVPNLLHGLYFKYKIADFVLINPLTGVEGNPLTYDTPIIDPNTGKAQFMYHRVNRNYYRLVSFQEKNVMTTDVSSANMSPAIDYDDEGNAFYSYQSPHKGAFIDNDQTVSIGSFSMYEAIRLVVPSGISFAPMLSSHSDARILCELRLPFQNSAEIQQGFLENKPVVMSTESAFLGDVIWNNPPSGLQYLPLTIADAGIYDLEVAVELIARDPDVPPHRVFLGYSDIFQVKLRFITRN